MFLEIFFICATRGRSFVDIFGVKPWEIEFYFGSKLSQGVGSIYHVGFQLFCSSLGADSQHIEKTCLTTFSGAISIPLLEFPRRQLSQKLKSSKNFQHAKKFHKCFLSPFLLCFFFETSPRDVH